MADTAIALDEFGKVALQRYTDQVNAYNAEVVKAKSVSSKEEFEAAWLTSDPTFAEFNAKIEKLESVKSERLIAATPLLEAAYAEAVANAGVDPAALDEQRKVINATVKYLTSIYGEAVLANTPEIERRGRTSGGGGAPAGGRRIRGFDIYVDGTLAATKNAKGEVKSTFSVAAKQLGVETVDLQRAFFEAAGSDDVRADDFPTVVEFDFSDKSVRAVKVDDSDEE